MPTKATQEPASFERRAYSIPEGARICIVSRATFYRLISDGTRGFEASECGKPALCFERRETSCYCARPFKRVSWRS